MKVARDQRVQHAAVLAKSLALGENWPVTAASDQLFCVEEGQQPAAGAVPAGRSKTFRRYDPTQQFLLPPSIDDWLPEGHEARFIAEAVDELLDLDPIYTAYVVADGAPP